MAVDSGTYDDATLARRAKIAEALLSNSMKPQKIDHWAQGLAQMGNAALGGYMNYQLGEEGRAGDKELTDIYLGRLGGTSPAATPTAAPSQDAPRVSPNVVASLGGGDFGNAISSIESGGKYDALGPVTKTGDRAYGKYQVMGANIPQWSKQALGRELSPDAFLADPKAQDAVFNKIFGGYADKYGPEGAARAWFAGEGGMNDLGRKDQLGTTVGQYGQKFAQAVGPQAVAQALPQPSAAPQDDIRGQIVKMLSSQNPKVRAAGRAQTDAYMAAQQKNAAPTDDIKEYERAQRDPAFRQYMLDMKRASAQNINLDQRGENAFAKKAGESQATRFNELVTGGQDAQAMVGDINALREIGGRITTGKQAEITAALGPYAEALGVKVDGLDDLQAYNAIVAKLAPRMRVPGSGATSDFEMQNFLKALPGLGKTPGGNELIANTLDAMQQHKIAAADIASRAMAGEITPKEAEKELRSLPDPMTLWKKQGKTLSGASGAPAAPAPASGPVKVTTPDEARKLPKGTKIILPDGSEGIVP